ncbi:hypothetical protein FRB98_001469, partial [Tulasnella sp. 332]
MSDIGSPLESITFQGRETENVTQFLQNVKRIAFSQGCQRDQEWLVDYVETCLADEALEWFIELDDETRFNFDRLRIAMVKRFRVAAPAIIPPAPPAAAPPPVASRPPIAPESSPPTRPLSAPRMGQQGRIKIVRDNGALTSYCGPERSYPGTQRCCCDQKSSESEALVVELCPSSTSTHAQLRLRVQAYGNSNGAFLGVSYEGPDRATQCDYWLLCFCNRGVVEPFPRAKALMGLKKQAASSIWELVGDTRELRVIWTETNG